MSTSCFNPIFSNFLSSACPNGWTIWNSQCYKLFHEEVSWEAAELKCIQLGAHLTSILSAAENEFVSNLISDTRLIWIGGSDKDKEGTWTWTDSNPWTSTRWANGQPDKRNTENCLQTQRSFTWHDYPCSNKANFVCKL